MSKHAPWTDEQADAFADQNAKDPKTGLIDPVKFYAAMDAIKWAAAQIEKCPTMYGSHVGDPINRYWESTRASCDTHEAKLVGVREVEK